MCHTPEPGLMECTSAKSGDNANTFEQNHTLLMDKERTERFVSLCVGLTVQENSSVVLKHFKLYLIRELCLAGKSSLLCTNHQLTYHFRSQVQINITVFTY
jgi:hypothetical protein